MSKRIYPHLSRDRKRAKSRLDLGVDLFQLWKMEQKSNSGFIVQCTVPDYVREPQTSYKMNAVKTQKIFPRVKIFSE